MGHHPRPVALSHDITLAGQKAAVRLKRVGKCIRACVCARVIAHGKLHSCVPDCQGTILG